MFAATTANAEPRIVRIATQYGISYLPLTIMAEKKLLESEGKKLGLDLSTEWIRFTGGPPMNEALISGNLDFASGGVGPMVTIWARTKGNLKVKGICALNSMPLWLNSINPNVKTIKDFTEKDRIALPAVRVSMQAVILQMAAEKVFGKGQEHKLDPWTVSLSHPDGLAQMMSGKSEITGHFTSAPFMYTELAGQARASRAQQLRRVRRTAHLQCRVGDGQAVRRRAQDRAGLPRGAAHRDEGDQRRSGRLRGAVGQGRQVQANAGAKPKKSSGTRTTPGP